MSPLVLSLGEILAGLGLLFVGLRLMSTHLQQALGGRIRHLLKRATRSAMTGFAAGVAAGVVTQSSNAVAVISGNLVRARLLATRDAVAVVAGGNVGTSALVLLAAIDLHVAVLFLVGLVGIGFQFGLDRRPAQRGWMGVMLGLALLFLGIDFIKSAPRHLDIDAVSALLAGMPPFVALILGLVAALATQSSSTATILVLAALKAGFIGLDDCFFVVIGANLGSGLATLLAAGGLSGVGRQLCYVHIMVKGLGSAILLALWIGAALAGSEPTLLFERLGGGDPARSVSLLFLMLQIVGALPVSMFRERAEQIANRFSPPSLEDSVSRPLFIDPDAVADPSGALELSEQEIAALIRRLATLLPDLDQREAANDLGLLARGNTAVTEATEQFVVELIGHGLASGDLDIALAQQARLEMLRGLQDTLADFAAVVMSFETVPPLAFNLSEALRMIIQLLGETIEGTPDDFEVLIDLTGDRSEHLAGIRRTLAATALGAEAEVQRLLLATSRFERAVWLVRRLAVALKPQAEARSAVASIHDATRDIGQPREA